MLCGKSFRNMISRNPKIWKKYMKNVKISQVLLLHTSVLVWLAAMERAANGWALQQTFTWSEYKTRDVEEFTCNKRRRKTFEAWINLESFSWTLVSDETLHLLKFTCFVCLYSGSFSRMHNLAFNIFLYNCWNCFFHIASGWHFSVKTGWWK